MKKKQTGKKNAKTDARTQGQEMSEDDLQKVAGGTFRPVAVNNRTALKGEGGGGGCDIPTGVAGVKRPS